MTLGSTQSDAQVLVKNMADTRAEVEAMKLGDTRGDAHALLEKLAYTLAEVKAVTTRQHRERCASTGRQSD